MKMTVIADRSGNVVSTYLHPEAPGEDEPTLHISGGPEHVAHELDVPAEFGDIESADELHNRVSEHLRNARAQDG